MKVLITGSGGREHALAWKCARSERVSQVWVAPGNAGTAMESGVENVDIEAGDIPALVDFARENRVDLTIVGPEAPLVSGISDRFSQAGLACFGPGRQAAQLEGSKAFSKQFLARHGIPTATWEAFGDVARAEAFAEQLGLPVVVKADGLAAGKGVVIAKTQDQARAAIRDMLQGNRFGKAGHRVVIEEFLQGEEASFICVVDGQSVLPMASSQDHKARDDGDTGPNTGGMGAYSPAPVVDAVMHEKIMQQVILPTVRGLEADGIHYCGFLYAGLMIGADGIPKVLEFNCRFGDPETQPILMRMESCLAELCLAAVQGRLEGKTISWDTRASLGVVMAAGGYPENYAKGNPISGLETEPDEGIKVFHAGTSRENGRIVTSGGRVLCVCALGDTVHQARQKAYDAIAGIGWEDAFFRKDIGYRAVAREQQRI